MSVDLFYSEPGIALYCGDARDVLPTLAPASVDLVLTDPPFFMPATHYQSRVKWQRSWSDTSILSAFWQVMLAGMVRTLKVTGHLLTFCDGDSYPVFYPEVYRTFDTIACLVWDKQSIGLGRIWRHQHELIIAARWETSEFQEVGGSRSDILRARATPSADRAHPVEKPSGLLLQLIEPTTKPGDVVLDPFAGSGTTLEAARAAGRHVIGIEGEERYCEVAANRLAAIPLPLFADPLSPSPHAPEQAAQNTLSLEEV